MATGFIRRIIALLGCLACGFAGAADIAVVGLIGDQAAVLAVDGGNPKTVKVGQKWNGITVVSVQKDRATLEVDGRKRVVLHGQHYRSEASKSDRQQVTLSADPQGHFVAMAAINGNPVRVLVDTGATTVALPGREAKRLGIDYAHARRGTMQTANGVVDVYSITLDRVRLGDIELHAIPAVVLEEGLGITLLGMSFLNRVEMRRDGEMMTLMRRF